ncbi:MAG: hypothetical protein GC136_07890 [Alphaproteobacteria bacterium]|nr:hypothetical protein [Alphaproteobacteria bacterium]
MKILHFCLFLLFLLAAFTGAGLLLQKKDALPEGAFGQKLSYFRDHGQEYDVVFIGNSRTYRQIDAPAMEHVCPRLKIFNFGIQNLMLEEMDFIVDWVKRYGKKNVEIIVSEPSPAMNNFKQMQSDRLVYFSSLPHLQRRFENIWTYNEPVHKKIYRSAVALYGTFYAGTHIGQLGKKLFPDAYKAAAEEDKDAIGMPESAAENEGYFSLDAHAKTNSYIYARQTSYFRKFDAEHRAEAAKQVFAPVRVSIFNRYYDGSKIGFFMPPTPSRFEADAEMEKHLHEKNKEAVILNMNDQRAFPQLFEADRWFDEGHLNETGAWEMSEMIAQELCTDVIH